MPSLDPSLIAGLGGEMAQRSVAYATLVGQYKAQHPNAGMADIVNNLVAAYCPVVARSDVSDQAKSLALKRFALNITSYLSNQSVAATEPDVGIIWAVPAGYSLAERDPRLAVRAQMSVQRQFARAAGAGRGGGADSGQTRSELPRADAIAQADRMLAGNPKAKLADLANALILAYCEGVTALPDVRDVEKTAALMRYGEEVIQRLQLKAELKERAPAAKAAQ